MSARLSVVIPALDEAVSLETLLPALRRVLDSLGEPYEVILVDGRSQDATVAVAERHGARVLRQRGRGYGAAVREGMAEAKGEWIVLMDADGSHPPETVARFWERREGHDLIVASRYCLGGSSDMPLTRHILSRPLSWVMRRVLDLPIRDTSSGLRLYRRAALEGTSSEASDFSVQQELLVRVLEKGGRVGEIPFHYAPRVGGRSKADAWRLAPAYIRLMLRLKPLRGGWRAEAGLALVLAAGLATGLCGLGSGLPGPGRWRALPPDLRGSPEFASRLAESWRRLYADIRVSHERRDAEEPVTYVKGRVEAAPGWTFPPAPLINSARSLMTQSENPDEKKAFVILSQMRPWRLEFEPLYVQYGGGFIYPFGAFLVAARALGLAVLTPDLARYLVHPEDMGRLYLLGRVYILLFHLGTLWVLYETGRLFGGRRAGVAAALLFAAAPFVVAGSHVLKPHPVSAFWLALAAHFMVRAVEEGRQEDYLGCGLAAGAAMSGSLILVFAPLFPLLARAVGGRGSWRWAAVGAAAGGGLAALLNPYLLLAPDRFAWELTVYAPTRLSLAPSALLEMATRHLPRGAGAATAVLLAAGTLSGLLGRDRRLRALAVAVLGGSFLLWLRFAAADESLLRIFTGPFALACSLGAALAWRLPKPAAAVAVLLALGESGARAAPYLADLRAGASGSSTREAAADWIDARVPAGARLGLSRFPEPAHAPPFRWDRLSLVFFETPAALGSERPEWLAYPVDAWAREDSAFRAGYETAAVFPRRSALGRTATDPSFYANAGMVVLRRSGMDSPGQKR